MAKLNLNSDAEMSMRVLSSVEIAHVSGAAKAEAKEVERSATKAGDSGKFAKLAGVSAAD